MSGDMPRKPNNELAAYSRAVNRQTFSANLTQSTWGTPEI